MTPKQSIEWVRKFESTGGELNYRTNGVDCWPIVRNTLLSALNSDGVRVKKGFLSAGLVASIKMVFFIFFGFIRLLFLKKTDVFILGDVKFSEEIAGRVYLKDAYVLARMAISGGQRSLTAVQSPMVNKKVVGREFCISVYSLIFLVSFFSSFLYLIIPRRLSGYIDELLDKVFSSLPDNEGGLNERVVRRQIRKNVVFCILASYLFYWLLLRIKPDKVFVVCYYSMLGMSICAACRKLDISSFDVQHGVSGRNMRAYTSWLAVPEGGYTTLPRNFLAWTEVDAKAIRDWAQLTHGAHKVLVTGSLWRKYKLSEESLSGCPGEWAQFLDDINFYKKRVVITLQSSVVHELLLELVRNCDEDVCFLVRAHPSASSREEVSGLMESFSSHSSVFVCEPTKMPIQLLMSVASVHITEWSASVYDAYFEGVPSIVVSREGADYFVDFIDMGFAFYSDEIDGLKSLVRTVSKFERPVSD
ncbi:hypothetical protein ACUTAH_22455 [Metapseudomonas furukawaii]|uniref:hypothetical protein n=1 Tax=Metapseudomonas furukawaii TaxID=1149133 RepID=UPI0040459459